MIVLGLSQVVEVAVIAPRHRAEELVKDLLKFEDFHPSEKPKYRDPQLYEMERRAELGYVSTQALLQELGVKDTVGLLDQLFGGSLPEPREFSSVRLKELLDRLESRSKPLVEELNKLMEKKTGLLERLNETQALYTSLKYFAKIELDLDVLKKFRRFHIFVGIASGQDIGEIRRSLPSSSVLAYQSDGVTIILVVSKASEAENVERVLKGLGVKPLTIPSGYPQNPKHATAQVLAETESLKKDLERVEDELSRLVAEKGAELVSLRDGYALVRETLTRLAGAGDLRSFAIAEGYVPLERLEEFKKTVGSKYPVYTESSEGKHHEKPSLMINNPTVKPFEKITLIQGPPKYGEIDPTPYVSVFFTIFYGIMFADLGQGLVILAFALYMMRRVAGDLREWAKLLAFLGASAAVAGFLLGEAFGFKVGGLIGSPELLHLVEEHGEAKQFNIAEVQRLLIFTILLGVVHMIVGYALSIVKYLREGEAGEALAVKAPSLAMYLFGILFALAFFGAGGDLQSIFTSANPVPLLNLPTNLIGAVGVYGAVACIITLLFGRYVVGITGLGHRTGIVSSVGAGLLEVLENIIHFLSNTISYSRLTILLVVHAALMLLLNTAWEALGLVSLPLLLVGNIGIMLLEGMLVFIQAMRLHVYEFFSKFYDGTGQAFRKLSRQTPFVKLRLE